MKTVLHLFNPERGSRYPLMLSEAMIKHSDVSPMFSGRVVSLGSVLAYPVDDLERAISEADVILRPEDEHFGLDDIDTLLAGHWGKVVLYDYRDAPTVNRARLEQARLYVKRVPTDFSSPKLITVDYGLLDEYICNRTPPRIISLAYLFEDNFGVNEAGRKRVYDVLSLMRIQRAYIGKKTTHNGRRAIFEPVHSNPFIEYLSLLQTSKIVVTCNPDHGGGDSRMWEAFGSGALVVTDQTALKWGFVDGEHCLIFNENSRESIQGAIHKALGLSVDERMRIAQDGQRYALANHRHIDRLNLILDRVN